MSVSSFSIIKFEDGRIVVFGSNSNVTVLFFVKNPIGTNQKIFQGQLGIGSDEKIDIPTLLMKDNSVKQIA